MRGERPPLLAAWAMITSSWLIGWLHSTHQSQGLHKVCSLNLPSCTASGGQRGAGVGLRGGGRSGANHRARPRADSDDDNSGNPRPARRARGSNRGRTGGRSALDISHKCCSPCSFSRLHLLQHEWMIVGRLVCKCRDGQLNLCLLWSVNRQNNSVCLLDTLKHRQPTERRTCLHTTKFVRHLE